MLIEKRREQELRYPLKYIPISLSDVQHIPTKAIESSDGTYI